MGEEGKKQQHFVLVHGACHGAWCWYKVVTRLRSDGHRVTALDLAAAGANPKRVEEVRSFSDYCQPLMEFMAALPPDEKVVLVGHSFGGICVSLAMEKFPQKIGLAVFVAAYMPGPDFPVSAVLEEHQRRIKEIDFPDDMDIEYSFANGVDKPPTSVLFGPKYMYFVSYRTSPPEDLTLASLSMRPIGHYPASDLLKQVHLTKENYGSIRRAFVVCDRDVGMEGFQEWVVGNNPADKVKTIFGADHMAMFSKPQELCDCLQDFAGEYC